MTSGRDLYYLDSCIFLAWLRDEDRPPGEMDGVRELTHRIEKNQISICTSAITFTEVIANKLVASAGTIDMFNSLMQRRSISRIAVDTRVARPARDLRDHYSVRTDITPGSKTLSVPDAIHLATALLYKAKKFFTFDRRHKNGSLGLLPLNGDHGISRLAIEKPVARQPDLKGINDR